ERVRGLASLEEGVRVLGGAAQQRAVRGERALAVRFHERLRHERAEGVVLEELDLPDLVGGAEAVEEVQEGDARLERGRVRDRGHVLRLLDRARGEKR